MTVEPQMSMCHCLRVSFKLAQITIVIPVFNEAKSLEVLLKELGNINSKEIQFLLVNNGSTDINVSTMLKQDNSKWNFVESVDNLGFGGGILFGISHTETKYVGWMPGNLKVDPRDVVGLLGALTFDENAFIKGFRTGRGAKEYFKTFFAGAIQSLILKSNMFDSGGTPTVCTRKFICELKEPPTDYVFESYVLYHARKNQFKVIRPHIAYGKRRFGESHWQRGIKSEIKLLKLIYISSLRWARCK